MLNSDNYSFESRLLLINKILKQKKHKLKKKKIKYNLFLTILKFRGFRWEPSNPLYPLHKMEGHNTSLIPLSNKLCNQPQWSTPHFLLSVKYNGWTFKNRYLLPNREPCKAGTIPSVLRQQRNSLRSTHLLI